MATYPTGVYSYTNRTGGQTLAAGTHSTAHNEVAAEVIATQTELGTNPSGAYSTVKDRLEALTSAIGAQHTQNTDSGSSSAAFYLNGASGAKLKETGGAFAVRNNADTLYVDFTCDDLTCTTINGITAAQLSSVVTNSHTHANSVLLASYTQTEVNLASAVSLKHVQNTDVGTTNETFQLNSGNVLSAKIKVDDLTPTIVDIRNAVDSAFTDARAANFRGNLQVNNADANRPTIRFNDGVTETWQFSNDGVTFYDITTAPGFTVSDTASIDLTLTGTNLSAVALPAGIDHNQLLNYSAARHFTVGGSVNEIQYNNGASGLAAESVFYYNPATDTLFVPNISVSGLIVGSVVAGGTTSDTWEVNSDGNGLILDTLGLSGDVTILATELDELTNGSTTTLHTHDHNVLVNYSANRHIDHAAVSISAGAGMSGGGDISATRTLTNADRGSVAVTTHETTYNHANLHSAATVTDSSSVDFTLVGQDITAVVLPAGVDHNSLSNYSANRHIDHTAVSISAGTGLTGGGDISANRTVSLSHLGIQNLTDPGSDKILFWDDSAGNTEWLTLGTNLSITGTTINATGGSTLTRATFTSASLTAGVLTITHSAGLSAPYTVMVTIFDNNNKQIIPDQITGSTNSVAVDLSSYGTISGTWGFAWIA